MSEDHCDRTLTAGDSRTAMRGLGGRVDVCRWDQVPGHTHEGDSHCVCPVSPL